ncbi:putative transcription factor C2H2 family [Helianthus annuus]|nr:putative transcription factor C2H2 family [Helianthus annuus]KAJ0888336.1 putative transcription factor C2H2 family [Helianthus annuus]
MASSSAEFASCLQIPKTQNNVDLSWLPNYNDSNNSDHSNNHITQNDSDDSWLPNYNDTNTKTPSKSSHSNIPKPLPKTNKDFDDDSWLPPTPVRNNKIKENHVYDPRISNHKKNIVTKTDLSKSYRKPDTVGADYSWLPSTPIVNNKDQKKQTNSNNNNNKSSSNNNQKNSSNYDNWERAREAATFSGHQQAQHTKVLSKQASTSSECSVETDSLGGVSTLLRRWKDVETKKPNQKLIPASCIKNNDHKTDESLVDSIPVSRKESFVGENKCFSRVVGKPRLIRGRQAYLDFLTMMEQDKRRELESLTQRKVVSNFPNRGRIQALLRVRFIRIRAENLKEAKSNKHSVSKTMKSIWDKFSTGVKQDTPASRKPKNNNEEVTKKPNASSECSADCSPVKEVPVTTTATTTASSQEPVSTTASHQSAQEDTHSEILLPNTADHQQKSQCPSPKMYSSGPENYHEWINEYSQTESDWNDEEEEEDYCSYNWVSDIARPRSDWECMRQERYEEMLHLQPSNQDISQLLERKTVSGFLSSGQRSMLDQLMVTRAQSISRTETKKEEKHEESEFTDQTAGSSPPTRSPALQERSRNHHRHRRSSQHHPSLDMEFIYDLRKHMEQIHQELMELRKAVTSCVNMQIKNQQQPIQKKRSEQTSPTRSCCVCYTMQADSFLYRCGHMCACYDCGLELQCTSGKCPICEDPILDVVRACAYGD